MKTYPKSDYDWGSYAVMRKQTPSRRSNAPTPAQSSSRDAHSPISAKRKSRPTNALTLVVRTPQNSEWLRQQGIIVPEGLDPSEEILHLDFTAVSDRHIGAIHSRFSVRHAHALYVRAGLATRLLRLKRKHRIDLAKHRVRYGSDFPTIKALEEDFSLGAGEKLEGTLMQLEIKATVMDSVIEGFMDIVKAASREMSRRDSERSQRD